MENKKDKNNTCVSGEPADDRLLDLMDDSGSCVYEMDNHGNFTGFSHALCRVLGYSREELLHQNLGKFMDRRQARKFYAAFNKVWVTHRGFNDLIWETVDKDGNRRVIELSAYLVKNHEGRKLGFRGIARDVTEKFKTLSALKEAQKRYEREFQARKKARERTRNLFDFVPYPMIVFASSGNVTYINPAFTQVFGWTLEELIGRKIPYFPPGYEKEAIESVRILREKPGATIETKRVTRDGRILDVIIRGKLSSRDARDSPGELFILRDVTEERRMERTNETLFQISCALPEYPNLEDLLDYITDEVKRLLNTEGAVVGLFEAETRSISFPGAAYDDISAETQIKMVRHPVKRGLMARVWKSGEAVVVNDTSENADFYNGLDNAIGFRTRNLVIVPLEAGGRIIGVLSAANKKMGAFDDKDRKLLTMIASTVALSIENARFGKELKEAYEEVASLNRAKDRIINHLSHELKTPASILLGSLIILAKRLQDLPEAQWLPTLNRARRNLDRILEIQYQVEDIMRDQEYKAYALMSHMVDECMDELETMVAEKTGDTDIVNWLRERLEAEFGPRDSQKEDFPLDTFIATRLKSLSPKFSHRQVDVKTRLDENLGVCMPPDVMAKVFDGLVKNAIENTPDGGQVDILARHSEDWISLEVQDFGVGIEPENQKRIFEGFFATQETMAYSSKHPFDFNAGGKGADLLRMKVFAERYGFKLFMKSERCRFLVASGEDCPGNIDRCQHCRGPEDCLASGGSSFTVWFPKCPPEKA